MEIRTLTIVFVAPFLLSLPMMCTHLGDDHHGGHHHSFQYRQSPLHDSTTGSTTGQGDISILQSDSEER